MRIYVYVHYDITCGFTSYLLPVGVIVTDLKTVRSVLKCHSANAREKSDLTVKNNLLIIILFCFVTQILSNSKT